jgi:hypothetical protein
VIFQHIWGLWKKDVALTPHIGTTEYTAVVCRQLMEKEAIENKITEI